MNELKVFQNKDFGEVRTVLKDGEPWFVAADVCRALEIGNASQALSRLDDDECSHTLISNEGTSGNPNFTIVSEPGLYTLVLGSRKPEARAFKRWITHDVIPSIRKHGLYAVDELLENPDIAIAAFTQLKEERARRRALETKVTEDKPYTAFARSIANSSAAILIGDFAKLVHNSDIKIGRNRLFGWLRANKYLMPDNKPYQRYVDQGLFEVRESHIGTIKGDMIKITTLLTGKGQLLLLDALQREFGVAAS